MNKQTSKPDSIIGLEIHVELDADSKLFCGCTTKAEEPNTATCEVCLGMPGSKPVVNKKAVEYAIKLCIAMGSKISPELIFSRKSYFYPDMSKNYQITQYEIPLGIGGKMTLAKKDVVLTRIHVEEDPASLVHTGGSIERSPFVLVDYNRSGRPLCEIVTEPELSSPEEAREFMNRLMSILKYLGVFDAKNGVVKADANVSVKESGFTRVEIKNITGFREIERALNYEIGRQQKELGDGKEIRQETRGWNPDLGLTFSLRSKETEEDYGYIVDPDLTVTEITREMVERIKKEMPELPEQKKRKLISFGVKEEDADIISSEYALASMFEKLAAAKIEPALAANWLRREVLRVANYNKIEPGDLKITDEQMIELLEMLQKKEITETVAKKILEKLVLEPFSPRDYVRKEKLSAVSDSSELEKFCGEAIKENPSAVADFRAGKEESLNFLVGQVMRKTRGKASPAEVNRIMRNLLK